MKKISGIEKETIINFNEAEADAEIYTHNTKLINRLKRYPSVAKLTRVDETGAHTFILPKKQMTITIREPMSDEMREKKRQLANKQIKHGDITPFVKKQPF